MGGHKDTGMKIPMLKKEDYFHWKVKMHLHLLSLDVSYVNCIQKGTDHVPMKIVTSVNPDGTHKHLISWFQSLFLSSQKKMRKRCIRARSP